MQLEELCISLGIRDHIPALSGWRDDLFRNNAAALQAKDAEITAKIAQLDAIAAAIADPTKNDVATLIAIEDAVAEAKLTDRQRELIELQEMRADIDAKIAQLVASPA